MRGGLGGWRVFLYIYVDRLEFVYSDLEGKRERELFFICCDFILIRVDFL